MPLFLMDLIEDPDDRELFETVFIAYKQMLYVQAYKILADESKAEDAVVETFLRLAKHFQKTDKIVCQRMMRYLVIINRNVSIDYLRKDSKEIAVPPDSSAFERAEGAQDEAFQEARVIEAMDALEKLPDKYRDVLYLTVVENMKAKDVAGLLHISEDLVWQRLKRGRAILSRELNND